MAKTKISEFSSTPGNNTDIDGINIAEGCAPSGINDAIRELMAQLKDFQAGDAGDSITVVGTLAAKGTSTSGADLKLYEDTDNGTNYVGFIAPASIAANVQWTLPSADGSSGQSLQTNGSGTLSFATLGISAGGTGQTTANAAFNALAPSQTGNSGRYLTTDGTNTSWAVNPLGTVTSVAMSVPSFLSVSGSPITSSGPLAVSLSGTALPTTSGGTGLTSFTANRVFYASSTSAIAQSANLTFDGTTLTANNFTDSSLTSGRVTYATTGGNLTDSANLTFDGTTLTANALTTSSTVTINGGTANGVAYLNGSKVLTTGSALTFDGTNFATTGRATAASFVPSSNTVPTNGLYLPAANTIALAANSTNLLQLSSTQIQANTLFSIAMGGVGFQTIFRNGANEDNFITQGASGFTMFRNHNGTEYMRLDASGNLGIGTSSPAYKLDVVGGSISASNAGNNAQLRAVDGTVIAKLQSLSVGYTGGWAGTESNHNFQLVTNNSAKVTLDTSGNLGLGVTPTATSSSGIFQNQGGILWAFSNLFQDLTQNAYYNTSYRYSLSSYAATMYRQQGGSHIWFNAPSGTAGNAISFTQAMTLDASGNLGIGTTSPSARFDLTSSGQLLANFNSSNASAGYIQIQSSGTNYGYIGSAATLSSGSSTDFTIRSNNNLLFTSGGGTERARITSGGDLLVGTTSQLGTGKVGLLNSASGQVLTMHNTNATPYGLVVKYTAVSPNNTGSQFIYLEDSTALRAEIRSNGGLANYSGNNVNLSDRREKTNFAPAKDYLDTICAIPVQTFNYIDQSEDDPGLTLGVVAQDVQAVAPELVMESNWGTEDDPKMRLSIYQTDLQYALMKCIQELKAQNDDLRARVAQLEAK